MSQAACSAKVVKWAEEVQLSNGEMIIVERETRFKPEAGGEPFRSSGWAADTMIIRFRYPSDAKDVIEWRTMRYSGTGGGNYRHPETPLTFDIDPSTDEILIVTIAGGTMGGCNEYFRYRYSNRAWRDDMLPEIFETLPANLLIGSDELDTPARVSLELKPKKNGRYGIRYKKVGPDRCLCGYIGNPFKGGCVQKYNAK